MSIDGSFHNQFFMSQHIRLLLFTDFCPVFGWHITTINSKGTQLALKSNYNKKVKLYANIIYLRALKIKSLLPWEYCCYIQKNDALLEVVYRYIIENNYHNQTTCHTDMRPNNYKINIHQTVDTECIVWYCLRSSP